MQQKHTKNRSELHSDTNSSQVSTVHFTLLKYNTPHTTLLTLLEETNSEIKRKYKKSYKIKYEVTEITPV